ncbi:hypothetical protein ACPA9J_08180 [Pseudomonas aeruginosa]
MIERLKEERAACWKHSRKSTERIFAMLQAKGETLHNLSNRPAAI